jgi:PEP-CTERM motif
VRTIGISATKLFLLAAVVTLFCARVPSASATTSTQSFTGTLATPESVFETTVILSAGDDLLLQTYGFGGGINAAGTVIAPGGTDPFLAIFSGTGPNASILTDGFGNPFGTSVTLGNFLSFAGCPPAGLVNFGGPVCADITMSVDVPAAGTYTVLLTDGSNYANAVFDNGTLGEGFADFTGGDFCSIVNGDTPCPNTSGNYALDVTTPAPVSATPEPTTLLLFGTGLFAVFAKRRRISSSRIP